MASVSENINKINQLISENIDDLVFIINDKFNCEYNNFEALTSKKHFNDFVHPKDSKRVIDFVKNIFQFGSGIEEARITNHNKLFSWFEIKGTKFVDDENIDKVFLLCRNISKLKSKEKEIKNYQKSYDQLAETLPEINYWKLLQSSESKTAIQRTREMLELVINNIPQFIYWKDKKLNYIGCNTRFAQINGFNRASLIIGKSTEDLRWGRDKSDYIKQAESKVMENMEAEYNVVELLSKPNGILTWFEINRIPLHDIEGRVEGILVTYEDITERKTAEQKLQESEENYRNLVINLSDIILEVGADGTVIYVSPQSYDIMGYHPTELIGRSAFKLIHPEDVPELAEIMLKGIQTKELIAIPHYRLLHKEGQVIEASAQGKYVDVGGNERFIGAIRDITIQKQIEEKLKESEENYRTIFNASPDYIYVTDVQGNFLEANPSLLKRVGSSLEELQQTNFVEYYDGDDLDGLMEIFKNLTLGKEIKGIEITAKNVRGEDFKYEVNAVPLKKDGVVTKILNLARDITDKKITEQKLKDSEIKYRHLFENSPYSIILVNRKGEIIDCNPATEKIFQIDMEEILDKSFLDITMKPENLLPLFKERFQTILEGVVPKPLEVKVTRSVDNKPIWISIDDTLVEIGGEIVFQVIVQDITEKKIAEQRLQSSQEELKVLNRELEQKIKERTKDLIESERQYRTTINSLGDPLHVINKNLKIILANQAIVKWLTELELESELVGKNLFSVFPFLPPIIEEEYKQVFETGKSIMTTESTILPASNAITETRKIPIFSGGEVEQVITIIRDITESREMEIQLKESEEKYRSMVNDLDIAFYRGEHKGGLLMYNQSLARMLDLDPDQNIIGKGTGDFFIDPKMREEYYKELEEKGYIRNFIAQIRKASGSIMTVDLNAHLIYDSDGVPIEVEGTFADITEKFRLQQELLNSEQKLREQNLELMKLDQVKNDFITMAAHELKTPLISISGYTDYILIRHRSGLAPEITADLVTVQRNVKRLEVLMDQLLDVMKIDEQKLMLQKEVVNVKDIINNCLDELSYLINEKNLEIALDINHEILLNVDPERIFTVFTNLISNAIKFSPDYKLIEINAKKTESKYIFKIKDNGIGLSDEELGRLFKKFERIKRPRESENINIKDSGTGLGLYISKGIIDVHGGEIWAESEGEDKGATFMFTLPI